MVVRLRGGVRAAWLSLRAAWLFACVAVCVGKDDGFDYDEDGSVLRYIWFATHRQRALILPGTTASPLNLLTNLNEIAQSRQSKGLRVAIGWNSNLDLIADATKVFELLGVEPSSTPADHEQINSMNSLTSTFQHFFEVWLL